MLNSPTKWSIAIVYGIASILLFAIDNAFFRDMIIMTLFWALLGMAWNIAGGYAGQFSIGNAAFLGIGAYTSTLLYTHLGLSPWFGMLIGGVLAAGVAALLGLICVRLKGYFFALATIAFGQIMYIVAIQWSSLTSGSMGISIPFQGGALNMTFSNPKFYGLLILTLTALAIYLLHWVEKSKLGYYLLALRENEEAARALGVDHVKIRVIALATSAFITAVAGAFYAQYTLFIDPPSLLSGSISVQIALIAIVGGVGTLFGPLLGALLVVPLGLLLRATVSDIPGFDLMINGAIMMIVVLFFPSGLAHYAMKAIRPLLAAGRRESWKQS